MDEVPASQAGRCFHVASMCLYLQRNNAPELSDGGDIFHDVQAHSLQVSSML